MVNNKGSHWATADEIAEARRLRALGLSYDDIKEKTGMSLDSLSRYVRDVKVPLSHAQVTKGISTHERERRRATIEEKQGNVSYAVNEEPTPEWLPDFMPTDPDEFDVSGLLPDSALVSVAGKVQQRYIDDTTRGTIFYGVPIEAIKAQIVTSTTLMPWSPEWMRDSRNQWEAIRLFTTLSNTELAERAGISPSSLSRYTKGTRTPSKGDLESIRLAMWSAMEDRLFNLDLWLCIHDYLVAHGLDPDDGDTTYSMDEALRWITAVGHEGENWEEGVTLDHLPSLTHVRSLMPVPEYRTGDSMLFGYLGFARRHDLAGA